MKLKILTTITIVILFTSCISSIKENKLNVDSSLEYCVNQSLKSIEQLSNADKLPIYIADGKTYWNLLPITAWTSGFWPGILWYCYEYNKNELIKEQAIHYTQLLTPLSNPPANDHDLGFQIFCSFGHAYRLTGNESYKDIILRTAETLATLYNPKVGTILSWPWMVNKKHWPHNTIIDNMMNLEMLFWASKNGGRTELYDIAYSHAKKTMENHFREDGSAYHVAVYDTLDGSFIKGVTHQGYADHSMWARGQAWAIYGYTMVYRETKEPEFLHFARKVTDHYLSRLPKDMIPYWDFDAPNIPNAPRDASAAAITASALLELSQLENDETRAETYKDKAIEMLASLSTEQYQSRETNPAFLLHSTGHYPAKAQIDIPLIYADYYYIEALTRLKALNRQ